MTRKQFFAELAKYPGVTLDTESELNQDVIQIDTPKGKVFNANGCHTMVVLFRNHGGQSWKPEAYADVVEQLKYGLGNCEDPDCDICEGR